MSLFKKPNRKYRARKAESDSEEEDIKLESNIEEPKNETILDDNEDESDSNHDGLKQEPKVNSKLKLSFDEEEEGETVFKVKKSVYSRRMGKYYEKEKEKKKKEKEKEEAKPELTDSEVPKPVTVITSSNVSDDESKESSVRKRMEKEKELSIKWVNTQIKHEPEEVDEVIEMPGSSGDEDDDDSPDFRNGKSDISFPEFRGVLERGVIPDAKTIYALKKQRQMARDAAEFISVDIEGSRGFEDNRLTRDDEKDKSGGEDDDDDDEDDERIDFAVDKEALEREKAREAFLQAQEEEENKDEYESEDELEKWEQEQIRKGGGSNLLAATFTAAQLGEDTLFSRRDLSQLQSEYPDFRRKTRTIPDHLLKPRKRISQNEVILKMTQEVKLMRYNLESNERYLSSIGVEIDQSKNNIKRLEEEIAQLETKCDSLRSMKAQGSN